MLLTRAGMSLVTIVCFSDISLYLYLLQTSLDVIIGKLSSVACSSVGLCFFHVLLTRVTVSVVTIVLTVGICFYMLQILGIIVGTLTCSSVY